MKKIKLPKFLTGRTPRLFNKIRKKTKLETIEKAISIANKKGIVTQGFFIFGLPGETKDSIRETID